MVVSILVLVALIFATPSLLGRPAPELASLPLLIIGMSRNESSFIVNVGGAVQAYRYEVVRITIYGSEPGANRTIIENDTYGLHTWVSTEVPSIGNFTVHSYFVDQMENYFEYNVTVRAMKDVDNRTTMVFTFPYEKDNANTRFERNPPDDFRWVIPRRGTLP